MTTYNLFGGGAGGSQASDGNSYTWGVEFEVTQSGCTLTQILFYWAGGSVTVNHACRLYTVDGAGTGTLVTGSSKAFPTSFTNGWQTVTLDSPISLTANQRYKACVWASSWGAASGGYTATGAYWSSGAGGSGITNGPLTAYSGAGSTDGQCSFISSSDAYPTSSFNSGNYWIDVTIDDNGGPGVMGPIRRPSMGALLQL